MELIVICVLAVGACATVLMSNGLDHWNDSLDDDDEDDDCDCCCHEEDDDWDDDED